MDKHPRYIRNFKGLLLGLAYGLMFGAPVRGDDTEIYFGSASSASNVRPNVLLVLDTSSSMTSTVSGTGMNRLDNMKQALHAILDSASNINVGLMRFHKQGGPVLYPVSYIDDDVCNIEDCSAGTTVTARIVDGADDAEQDTSGAVSLDSDTLELVTDPAAGVGSTTTVSVQISSQNDAVEEESNGDMYMDSTDLELVHDGSRGNQTIGLRFQVPVPPGATIDAADITFTVSVEQGGSLDLDIHGQAHDDAPAFDGSDADNVSDRIASAGSIAGQLDWDNVANPAVNNPLTTPDLKAIVQAIVDRTGWVSNNHMVFVINKDAGSPSGSSNKRELESSGIDGPVLNITYTTSTPVSNTANQAVGLRFQNVQVPQGVTITSAYLEFEAAAAGPLSADFTVAAEASDNAAAFSATANDISARSMTGSFAWNGVDAWTTVNEKYQSPDISALLQQVIDRGGWCGGNDVAMVLTGSGLRHAVSYDSSPGAAPALRVTYDPATVPTGGGGGCINQTIVKTVASDNDDAEQASGGSVDTGSSDLELITDDTTEQLIGLRFQNLAIPQAATVLSAAITFEIDEDAGNNSDAVSLTINGEARDDAVAFTSNNNDIGSRPTTSAAVTWSSLPAPVVDEKISTPDLTAIVQEIVNRSGWASGNDMAFIIERAGGSGRRVVASHDGEAIAAPQLIVQIQWDSGNANSGAPALLTVRNRLHQIVDEIEYKSGTPMIDTMYEAARYWRGMDILYGAERGPASDRSRSQYTRVSHPASYTGGTVVRDLLCSNDNLNADECIDEYISGTATYISPIPDDAADCQANHMVVLSDGDANNNNSVSLIEALPGLGSCTAPTNGPGSGGTCGVELAEYLYTQDQSTAANGDQAVITHTIGFNFSDPWLGSVASAGGGGTYQADTASELASVFESIIAEALKVDSTFVAPGIAVNQFNRLTHRNEIYFSLFRPDDGPYWPGNLKKYQVAGTPPAIVDQNGDAAIDSSTGYFNESTQSFWSIVPDGTDAGAGGVAANLQASGRKVYTNGNGAASGSLIGSDNLLHEDNAVISKSVLGIDSETDAYRTSLLQWARGVDVLDIDEDGETDDTRTQIGDPLHSRPIVVTYGGSNASPDMTVFFGTNEGYLHAVDPDDGSELFAYMPWELLGQLDTLYGNSASSAHPYGMDGEITPDVVDLNGDGQIEPTVSEDLNGDGSISLWETEHVYLYTGMRRGGRSYYAFDLNDRSDPRLLWTINNSMTDFAELGQTWSKPKKTKVRIGSVEKDVLIFAGGYDPDQDGHSERTADDEGRAIYIVDAGSGALIWAGGGAASTIPALVKKEFAAMQYSIPSEVRVIDINSDGLADQLYVGDMGGQLWRFDIQNGQSGADLVEGAVIAELGDSTGSDDSDNAASNRRFYNAPSVAVVARNGSPKLTLTVGSGWRAHPLDNVVEDRFYMLNGLSLSMPTNADGDPDYAAPLGESDLYDATTNQIQQGVDPAAELAALNASSGWYIRLDSDGEKVLAESAIINHQVMFTTYSPARSVSVSCRPNLGTARFYLMELTNASAVMDLDGSAGGGDVVDADNNNVADNLTVLDRSITLKNTSIPSELVVYLGSHGSSDIAADERIIGFVGTETVPIDFGDILRRTFWQELDNVD